MVSDADSSYILERQGFVGMHEQGAPWCDDAPDPAPPGADAPTVAGPLQAALDQVRESALVSGAEGIVRYANPAAATLFGTGPLVGRPVAGLVGAPPVEVTVLLAAVEADVDPLEPLGARPAE